MTADARGARRLALVLVACQIACRADVSAAPADAEPVRFTIDASRRFPISRFIYGVNGFGAPRAAASPRWPQGVTLSRFGGNRLTTYNWENGASNAGIDHHFHNDDYLGTSTRPGEAVRLRVGGAFARGAGIVVTVPMIGHVARDAAGTSVGTDPATIRERLASRFVPSYPGPGNPVERVPRAGDSAVFQDEFIAWLSRAFPLGERADTTPVFYQLDNEPDLWASTHEEVTPKVPSHRRADIREAFAGGAGAGLRGRIALLARTTRGALTGDAKSHVPARLTYDALIGRTIEYATAIKRVHPAAIVFGPSTATWTGATTLGRWPEPDPRYGRRNFLDVYLERLRDAERSSGRRLLDVLDLHWYPEPLVAGRRIDDDTAPQTRAMIEARLQAPRSLWDSTYDERSWVSSVQGGPVRLLPLLREKIDAHNPGTRIAITEYYFGRGADISGGIAEADALGIFGREGVFAATLWPILRLGTAPRADNVERAVQYLVGAFRMYRDFDGRGGVFGSTGLAAGTSDPAWSSIYASTDDSTAARIVVVAINKRRNARTAILDLGALRGWRSAEVYTLTDRFPSPRLAAELRLDGGARVRYDMPPSSVSTLVLRRRG